MKEFILENIVPFSCGMGTTLFIYGIYRLIDYYY